MHLTVELTENEAWEWAQFLKRSRWDTYRDLATNDDEARLMVSACEKQRNALADAGVNPR
jgi:hypothetical protein